MRGSDYTTHLFTSSWFVVVIGFLTIIIKQNKEHNTFSFCFVPWVKRKELIIKIWKVNVLFQVRNIFQNWLLCLIH